MHLLLLPVVRPRVPLLRLSRLNARLAVAFALRPDPEISRRLVHVPATATAPTELVPTSATASTASTAATARPRVRVIHQTETLLLPRVGDEIKHRLHASTDPTRGRARVFPLPLSLPILPLPSFVSLFIPSSLAPVPVPLVPHPIRAPPKLIRLVIRRVDHLRDLARHQSLPRRPEPIVVSRHRRQFERRKSRHAVDRRSRTVGRVRRVRVRASRVRACSTSRSPRVVRSRRLARRSVDARRDRASSRVVAKT